MGTFLCERCKSTWPDIAFFSCPKCYPRWSVIHYWIIMTVVFLVFASLAIFVVVAPIVLFFVWLLS